jgi:hypothetical protein
MKTLIYILAVMLLSFLAGRGAAVTLEKCCSEVSLSNGEFTYWQEI